MTREIEEFWAAVPEKADHPVRVPILEAFRWIGEPLSAIDLVDLFEGRDLTMWEAAYHLRVLQALGMARPYPAGRDPLARRDAFDLPYRLEIQGPDAEGRAGTSQDD